MVYRSSVSLAESRLLREQQGQEQFAKFRHRTPDGDKPSAYDKDERDGRKGRESEADRPQEKIESQKARERGVESLKKTLEVRRDAFKDRVIDSLNKIIEGQEGSLGIASYLESINQMEEPHTTWTVDDLRKPTTVSGGIDLMDAGVILKGEEEKALGGEKWERKQQYRSVLKKLVMGYNGAASRANGYLDRTEKLIKDPVLTQEKVDKLLEQEAAILRQAELSPKEVAHRLNQTYQPADQARFLPKSEPSPSDSLNVPASTAAEGVGRVGYESPSQILGKLADTAIKSVTDAAAVVRTAAGTNLEAGVGTLVDAVKNAREQVGRVPMSQKAEAQKRLNTQVAQAAQDLESKSKELLGKGWNPEKGKMDEYLAALKAEQQFLIGIKAGAAFAPRLEVARNGIAFAERMEKYRTKLETAKESWSGNTVTAAPTPEKAQEWSEMERDLVAMWNDMNANGVLREKGNMADDLGTLGSDVHSRLAVEQALAQARQLAGSMPNNQGSRQAGQLGASLETLRQFVRNYSGASAGSDAEQWKADLAFRITKEMPALENAIGALPGTERSEEYLAQARQQKAPEELGASELLAQARQPSGARSGNQEFVPPRVDMPQQEEVLVEKTEPPVSREERVANRARLSKMLRENLGPQQGKQESDVVRQPLQESAPNTKQNTPLPQPELDPKVIGTIARGDKKRNGSDK